MGELPKKRSLDRLSPTETPRRIHTGTADRNGAWFEMRAIARPADFRGSLWDEIVRDLASSSGGLLPLATVLARPEVASKKQEGIETPFRNPSSTFPFGRSRRFSLRQSKLLPHPLLRSGLAW